MSRTFSATARKAIRRMYLSKCARCGANAPAGEADHATSWSRGGPTTYANAQWLCFDCNRSKSSGSNVYAFFRPMPRRTVPYTLRRWQREAAAQIQQSIGRGVQQFFCAAGVGSGKSKLGLETFIRGDFDLVIIVTPKSGIRGSWMIDAKDLGLTLVSVTSGASMPPIHDGSTYWMPHGYVLNAQMLRSLMADIRALCERHRVLVILDEAHHYTNPDELPDCEATAGSWSAAIEGCFEKAAYVLALSGTPYRNDRKPIAALNYTKIDDKGVGQPDFVYSSGDALRDGHVAPVITRFIGGSIEKKELDGRSEVFDFADGDYSHRKGSPDLPRMGERLRLATIESKDWQHDAVRDGLMQLEEFRRDGRPWGGLIICATIRQAEEIHKHLTERFGRKAMLLVRDAETEEHVRTFNDDTSYEWIVAITKVSEGISIPRLRCGVLITNVTAKTMLEQLFGRLKRLYPGVPAIEQTAVFIMPADPRNLQYAIESNGVLVHTVPWLQPPPDDGDPDKHNRDMEDLRRRLIDLGGIDNGASGVDVVYFAVTGDDEGDTSGSDLGSDPSNIERLRKHLTQAPPVINIGSYVLYARPEGAGAVVNEEFITEDEFLAMRRKLAVVFDPRSVMRAQASTLGVMKRMLDL